MRADRLPWFAIAAAVGLLFIAMWADVIPVDPKRLHGPRWLLAAVGLCVLLLGHAIASAGDRGVRGWSALI